MVQRRPRRRAGRDIRHVMTVFADSSALYAVIDTDEVNNERAARTFMSAEQGFELVG